MTTTATLVWAHFAKFGPDLYYLDVGADGTEEETLDVPLDKSLGDKHEGDILKHLSGQAGDGSVLDQMNLYDDTGGLKLRVPGDERGPASTPTDRPYNAASGPLAIPVTKGMVLKLLTTD